MNYDLYTRWVFFLCRVFGHKPVFSHNFKIDHYTCARCKMFCEAKP